MLFNVISECDNYQGQFIEVTMGIDLLLVDLKVTDGENAPEFLTRLDIESISDVIKLANKMAIPVKIID